MADTLITKLYKILPLVALVIFMAVFAGLEVVSFPLPWWGMMIMVVLVGTLGVYFVQAITTMSLRAVARQKAKSWPALARAMGLTYEPDDHSLWGDRDPAIRGEYRGHLMMMGFARTGYAYSISSLEVNVPADIPRLSLVVKNPANIRFTIQPKGFFVRTSRIEAVSSGDEDFNKLFVVKGQPGDYVKRAVQRIVASGFHVLDCLHRNISIELNGSNLACTQGRVLAVEDQIALFNLLCDLAKLAEQIGSMAKQEVTYD